MVPGSRRGVVVAVECSGARRITDLQAQVLGLLADTDDEHVKAALRCADRALGVALVATERMVSA